MVEIDSMTKEYAAEVRLVVKAIQRVMGPVDVTVTDSTRMEDFWMDSMDIMRVCFELQVPIASSDFVWQVAKRLRQRSSSRRTWLSRLKELIHR